MPRKRRQKTNFPPRGYVQTPVSHIFDNNISPAAFRLYSAILALSWEHGYCPDSKARLARLLGLSRQYVSNSLLGELRANDLVHERTLDGRTVLVPCAIDLDGNSLIGHRLFEDDADGILGPKLENETGPSRTPHDDQEASVNYSCGQGVNYILQNGAHEEEEIYIDSIFKDPLLHDEKPSTISDKTTGNGAKPSTIPDKTPYDPDFAEITALWCQYFGDISPVVADLIGDYLDDPEVEKLAGEDGAAVWVLEAIKETALNEANSPNKYFRAVMNDWIRSGRKTGGDNAANRSDSGPDKKTGGERLSEAAQEKLNRLSF
jgi:hypothetical protein